MYAAIPRLARSQLTGRFFFNSQRVRAQETQKSSRRVISDEAAYSCAIIPDSGFFQSFQVDDAGQITAIAESECAAMCCFADLWHQCQVIELLSDNVVIE